MIVSYQADLLNAYRDQLSKIRAAFDALEFEECYAIHGIKELEAAIGSTEADNLEKLYDNTGSVVRLPHRED